MSGISKRVSGSWVSDDYGIMKTATDTFTTLPVVLYPNAATATIGLKGNTVQNGTPTPNNPVMPQGCGERTGNLYNVSAGAYQTGARYISDGEVEDNANYSIWTIGVSTLSSGTYTFSLNSASTSTTTLRVVGFKNGVKVEMIGATQIVNMPLSITVTDDYDEIRFSVANGYVGRIMLNTGSTPLPYEPYGIEIPISSNSTTTPVYLGEVQTTRKIKKLVLDGTEDWKSINSGFAYLDTITDYSKVNGNISICTHFRTNSSVISAGDAIDGVTFYNAPAENYRLYIKDSTLFTIITTLKSWLAEQYAAGTPVTVWYVLATPETAVVNEPLMKIGDYADEVSGITIPVTAGGDTLSVDTTVQPSEVTVNYKGWHTGAVHERDNGAWT